MKLIQNNIEYGNRVACQECHSVMEVDCRDLHWTHEHPGECYFVCPVCKSRTYVYLSDNPHLRDMYGMKRFKRKDR